MTLGSITSTKAYFENLHSGVLSERRAQAYQYLGILQDRLDRGATSAEVWAELRKVNPNIPQHSINPRWVELKEQGVVREAGTVVCTVTNRECVAWEIIHGAIAQPRPKTPKSHHDHNVDKCGKCLEIYEEGKEFGDKIADLQRRTHES